MELNVKLKSILSSPNVFASTLLVFVFDRFQMPWLEAGAPEDEEPLQWAPSTFKLEIAEHYGVLLPDHIIDRLMAAINIVTTDDFWTRLPRFIRLCNILSGDDYDPDVFDPADVDEIAWGVTEASLLSPRDDKDFDDTVLNYIAFMCRWEGVARPAGVLAIGNHIGSELDQFIDDPELYNHISSVQSEKIQMINELVSERTEELFKQLAELPLQHGESKDLIANLAKELGSKN